MDIENNILKFEIINTIIILILGILLHFTFEWSNQNLFIGTFSSINESTWEHLKLLFFPMLITLIIGTVYFKIPNYACIKTKAILLAMSFIIIFFYTYTGVLGTNISLLNIGSFFIAVFLAEYYTYKQVILNSTCNNILAYIILIILLSGFILFTYFPPQIGLFKDPVTSTFGIKKNYSLKI